MNGPDLSIYGGKVVNPPPHLIGSVDPNIDHWDFGWIPSDNHNDPEQEAVQTHYGVTPQQLASAIQDLDNIPDLQISGAWSLQARRYSLWRAPIAILGRPLPYVWQVTGSCVGAGGSNAARTSACVEITMGHLREYKEIFWLFTYGRSRHHAGLRGRGEGSFGAAYAKASLEDGFILMDNPNVPKIGEKSGWLQTTQQVEMAWSDGAASNITSLLSEGRQRIFKAVARCRSADDVIAALANGYCVTQASMFGTRTMIPSARGNPAVRIAAWDGSWAHQMFIDEFWDHPTEGELFRVPNNWGPTAHGSPTGDEPAGGFYVKKDVVQRMCTSGEVFAFSGSTMFPARPFQPWIF